MNAFEQRNNIQLKDYVYIICFFKSEYSGKV